MQPGHCSLLFLLLAPVPRQLRRFLLVEALSSQDAPLVQAPLRDGGSRHPQPLQDLLFDSFQLEPVPIPGVGPGIHCREEQQELQGGEGAQHPAGIYSRIPSAEKKLDVKKCVAVAAAAPLAAAAKGGMNEEDPELVL